MAKCDLRPRTVHEGIDELDGGISVEFRRQQANQFFECLLEKGSSYAADNANADSVNIFLPPRCSLSLHDQLTFGTLSRTKSGRAASWV